jgi:hypothetical protein
MEESKIDPKPFVVYWHTKEKDSDEYKITTIGIDWEIDKENDQALVYMTKNINEIQEDKREEIKEFIKKQLMNSGWSGEIKYK